ILSTICTNVPHSDTFRHLASPHLYLPAFPTRRSSDLLQSCGVERDLLLFENALQPRGDVRGRQSLEVELQAARQHRRGQLLRVRSEEHTSELQSPDHLVCRLLLEKKKKRT